MLCLMLGPTLSVLAGPSSVVLAQVRTYIGRGAGGERSIVDWLSTDDDLDFDTEKATLQLSIPDL